MPIFQHLLDELNKKLSPEEQIEYIDSFRKQKIQEIKKITKRDVLVYFSDLKKNHSSSAITWDDKTCFADVIEGLNKEGVDVLSIVRVVLPRRHNRLFVCCENIFMIFDF